MIHKMPSSQPGHVRIVFELPACIWADRIFLVGEFNQWCKESIPFVQGRDGVWRATVDLPCGRSYQFRYLVDGSWQTDYHADGWVDNDYGSQNSVVHATYSGEVLHANPTGLLREEMRSNGRIYAQTVISPTGPIGNRVHQWKSTATRVAG